MEASLFFGIAGYSIFIHSRAIALRSFCLLIFKYFFDYQQKNPLKYYILPFIAVYRFMVNVITQKEMLTGKEKRKGKDGMG